MVAVVVGPFGCCAYENSHINEINSIELFVDIVALEDVEKALYKV